MAFCIICECCIDRGVENDLVLPTCDACAEVEGWDVADDWAELDGQPDEAQEWYDYDPDC